MMSSLGYLPPLCSCLPTFSRGCTLHAVLTTGIKNLSDDTDDDIVHGQCAKVAAGLRLATVPVVFQNGNNFVTQHTSRILSPVISKCGIIVSDTPISAPYLTWHMETLLQVCLSTCPSPCKHVTPAFAENRHIPLFQKSARERGLNDDLNTFMLTWQDLNQLCLTLDVST